MIHKKKTLVKGCQTQTPEQNEVRHNCVYVLSTFTLIYHHVDHGCHRKHYFKQILHVLVRADCTCCSAVTSFTRNPPL